MESKTFSALDRLQAEASKNRKGKTPWLDQHRDDLKQVVQEKGVSLTAQLLGIVPQTLYSYIIRSHIPYPDMRKGGQLEQPAAPDQEALYWRAKAEAYEKILEKLLRAILSRKRGDTLPLPPRSSVRTKKAACDPSLRRHL